MKRENENESVSTSKQAAFVTPPSPGPCGCEAGGGGRDPAAAPAVPRSLPERRREAKSGTPRLSRPVHGWRGPSKAPGREGSTATYS